MKLIPETSYGLRIYRNQSMLLMHTDSPETHVISSILHVDHDDDPDSEKWPLVIEDFEGTSTEVFLESGDMLFYESSKLLHGRPRRFNGHWYSSIFLHYRPVGWTGSDLMMDAHYRVPPDWFDDLSSLDSNYGNKESENYLEVYGTSYYEPNCEGGYCGLKNSVKRSGSNTVPISTGSNSDEL